MIAVETVIKKLVSDYEFVIIPGFGALLSRQVPAIYDQESGIFSPPVKKLAFNEFLKLDDGFLANYISREEKIAHTDAIQRIKQYTDVLKSALSSNGETKIEGIGHFNTNGEGKLVFEPNVANWFKDEWYGFTNIGVKVVERKAPILLETPHVPVIEEHVEVLEPALDRPVKTNWFKWTAAAALVGLMFYVSFFLVGTGIGNNQSTLNPFAYSDKQTASVVVEEPAMTEPAPVMAETVTEHVDEALTVAPTEVIKPTEIVKTDSSATPTPSLETKPTVVAVSPVVSVPSKRYYLIAGTFNGTKRANVLLADLQKKGFKDALVILPGEHSRKVKVAVQGFDAEEDAYAASGKLKAVIGEPGWVFKM